MKIFFIKKWYLVEKIPDYRIIISTKIYFYEHKKIPNCRDNMNKPLRPDNGNDNLLDSNFSYKA
jgi:hypothetical protein